MRLTSSGLLASITLFITSLSFVSNTSSAYLASFIVPVSSTNMAACSATATPGKCVPCEGLDDSARLSLEQAQKELSSMSVQPSVWRIQEKDNNMLYLQRTFTAKNFQAALDAINAMGAIAEREGHHPNFHLTDYRNVQVEIWTHSLSGLTQNDFVLANLFDTEVKIEYSPKWLRENPDAKGTNKE
jgi:4a-hydroxytetrahydrobiopterin dehydratase